MDKLKVWLIPGLIALLAIGALFYFRGQLPQKVSVPGDEKVTVEVEVTRPKGFAKPEEPTLLEKAQEDAAAMAAAFASGDLADCANITWDEEMRKRCEDNMNYAASLKVSDEATCKKIYDEALRNKCLDRLYLSAAIDQNSTVLCEKIKDPGLKQMCLDQVSALLARNARSISDCASIKSEILKKQCENNFYLKNSASSLDLSGCDNISDPRLAEQCRQTVARNVVVMETSKAAAAAASTTVAADPKDTLAVCNRLTGTKAILCKDAVYPQLALEEKDLSYCDLISTKIKVDECIAKQSEAINSYLLRQAIATNDSSLCDRISDENLKNICINS